MTTTRTYLEARNRGCISTGDVIAFAAIPFPWRKPFSKDALGWLSNRGIRRKQFFGQWRRDHNHRDGFHDFIHVGFVVRKHSAISAKGDEVMLYEYHSGMDGLVPTRLSERVRDYPGKVMWLPLTRSAQRRVNLKQVDDFMLQHRKNGYSWRKLIFAEAHWIPFIGRQGKGRKVCSEAVMAFWRHILAVPDTRRIWRRGHLEDKRVLDHHYSPQEIMQHCAIDNARIAILEMQ